jgi:hypothetical protein
MRRGVASHVWDVRLADILALPKCRARGVRCRYRDCRMPRFRRHADGYSALYARVQSPFRTSQWHGQTTAFSTSTAWSTARTEIETRGDSMRKNRGKRKNNALQEKVATLQIIMAENAQRLHQYQWIETTQLTVKGKQKPPTQELCRYGADGQVQKTPLGAPPEQPSGGRIRERIIEREKEEMKEYLGEVKSLIGRYVPPDPQKIAQAHQNGKISLNPAGAIVNFVFRDYVQPGDQMTLSFDTTARKIVSLDINTYMGEAKDKVTFKVQMGSLPDGTNFTQQSVLNAGAKHLQATTTNSDYRKLGGF